MNILAIVKLYFHRNKSGGEAYLHILLKKMKLYLKDCKINVLIPDCKEIKHFEFEGINIIEFNKDLNNCLTYIRDCDLLIAQLDHSIPVIKKGIELNKKIFWILHGKVDLFAEYYNLAYKHLYKIFNSNFVYLESLGNTPIENYYIINPMCDFPRLNRYKNKSKQRREYITLINPSENKGADIVLELAKRNKQRKFLIVEGGYHHEAQNKYIYEFRKLPNCHVIKNTSNIIEDVYLKSRIVLMPSIYESWGMVASEAISMGIPVIYSNSGPHNHLIGKGLSENMGKLSLGCYRDYKEFQKCIELLDNPPTYHLWSNLYNEIAEENYYKNEEQIQQFFENVFK